MSLINISSYRFVTLDKEFLIQLRAALKQRTAELDLKGTILLSEEGINLFVSGLPDNINAFHEYLNEYEPLRDLWFKESPSDEKPFTRMLVRLKKEIIAMGHDDIKPMQKTAPYVDPKKLEQWYKDNKDVVILDTRNDYEVRVGAFDDAVDLDIHTFREFPEAIKKLPEEYKHKTIVTYCTGGIRCEKAAIYMKEQGFENVYQLDGGILNYFEQCGGEHYHGDCFVFDKRVAVDPALQETPTKQCFSCRQPIEMDMQSDDETCPYCHKNINGKRFYAHLTKEQKQQLLHE